MFQGLQVFTRIYFLENIELRCLTYLSGKIYFLRGIFMHLSWFEFYDSIDQFKYLCSWIIMVNIHKLVELYITIINTLILI